MAGKLIGFIIGFLTGGIIGAIIGLVIGHNVDKALQQTLNRPFGGSFTPNIANQAQFLHATYSVMGHLSKAKGRVTTDDIQLATKQMDRMNLTGTTRKEAQEAFKEGKDPNFPLSQVLTYLRQNCARRVDLLNFFLEMQIEIAFSDGIIHPKERDILQTIAKNLGFSEAQLVQLLQMQEARARFRDSHFNQQYSQQQGQQQQYQRQQSQNNYRQQYNQQYNQQQKNETNLRDAYNILGLTEKSSINEVKKAYRKLMNEHHPDKLISKGLPPEMMEMAKEKAQQIQAAYDTINKALKSH